MMAGLLLGLLSLGAEALNEADHRRARQTGPSERLRGRDAVDVAAKINAALRAAKTPLRDCETVSLTYAEAVLRILSDAADPALDAVYADGRKRRPSQRSRRPSSDAAFRAKRDAMCAEMLMLWAHHLTEEARAELRHVVRLPTLPVFNETLAESLDPETAAAYRRGFTCQTGHGIAEASADGSDHVLPHWPAEVHYTGVGHGAYPFWVGAEGAEGEAAVEVWYSERLAAELFSHEACYLGQIDSTFTSPVPCAHLMTGTVHPHGPPPPADDDSEPTAGASPPAKAKAYLYSKDLQFCCKSSGSPEDLSAPKSDFMDKMTLDPNRTDVTTEFYDGPAKFFTMKLDKGELVGDFWYVTTPDGHPIQQGEGGTGPGQKVGHGNLVWHDYNLTDWAPPEEPFDPSIFQVPVVCEKTQRHCAFP